MSTAPLNRGQQIELMKNSETRLADFVQKWKSDKVISSMLIEEHSDVEEQEQYARVDERIACCG